MTVSVVGCSLDVAGCLLGYTFLIQILGDPYLILIAKKLKLKFCIREHASSTGWRKIMRGRDNLQEGEWA